MKPVGMILRLVGGIIVWRDSRRQVLQKLFLQV